jgi:hypothetical protein
MSLLVAVKSCADHLDRGFHWKIRETWGTGLDVKFFIGDTMRKHEPDEVILACPDDYHSLPLKTREICKWATGKMIDYLFICDTDTYVIPSKLLACGFDKFDYAGKIDREFGVPFAYQAIDRDGQSTFYPRCWPWASGGYGYFLSRKAFTIIADKTPVGWAEDLWIGQVLSQLYLTGEITMLNIPGGSVSEHFPSHVFKSGYDLSFNWMEQMRAKHS